LAELDDANKVISLAGLAAIPLFFRFNKDKVSSGRTISLDESRVETNATLNLGAVEFAFAIALWGGASEVVSTDAGI
jgi:hypothetical protein